MRELLFRGQTRRYGQKVWMNGEKVPSQWVYGGVLQGIGDFSIIYGYDNPEMKGEIDKWPVYTDTLCQYTGMHEFVNQDPSICGKLFEGDIVEVWSRRRLPTESYWTVKSQYDGECLVRATIVFKWGKWMLDYDNEHNRKLAAARGGEEYDRVVNASSSLCEFSTERFNDNGERFRRLNPNKKWYDIVRIGCIHDNPELLEAK